MRTYSFRVWDNRLKMFRKNPFKHVRIIHDAESFTLVTYEDKVIEQATGIRDRNGQMIFEGDIVHSPGCAPEDAVVTGNVHEGVKQ